MGLNKAQKQRLDQRIQLNMERQEEQLYANMEKKRYSIGKEKRTVLMFGLMVIVLFAVSFLSLGTFLNGHFSFAWIGHYALRRVNDLVDLILGNHLQSGINFFLCQFICPIFAGAALAAAGTCFQSVFHNPMASPSLLGVESGGQLGALFYLLLFGSKKSTASLLQTTYEGYSIEYHMMSFWDKFGEYVCTFGGCITIVIIVLLLTKTTGRGKISTVPLLLGGTVFITLINSILQAVTYYVSVYGNNPGLLMELQQLRSGAFTNIQNFTMLLLLITPIAVSLIILMFFTGKLNIIAFGEDEAKLMGLDVSKYRNVILLLSTVMTASVIAFCGSVGFIGLMVPHIARMAVGNDSRHLVPTSAFIGSLFMLIAYDISYMSNFILNEGMIINVVGGLVFTVIMIRYRRRGNADWA